MTALVADLHTSVRALVEIASELDDAQPTENLDADLIALEMIQKSIRVLNDVQQRLATALGNAMGGKYRAVDGVGMYERVPKRESTKCMDDDGLWRYVIDTRLIDPETGEIIPTHEVIRRVYGAESKETGKVRLTGSSPSKVEAVGIDWEDFFEKGERVGWTIKHK
jgi:hypothetical protein